MSYRTAYERWRGLGPYYAMFPLSFVDQIILRYTNPGQRVLDPFAGRASTVFSSATYGRPSIGIEINPIGWIYGKTKLEPAAEEQLKGRIDEITQMTDEMPEGIENNLGIFFRLCFSKTSLRFLIAARKNLNWKYNKTDRTLMAIILVDLHGVRARSFSNQMRQSKAMSPDYSVKWWRKHKLKPPQINPQRFLEKKIAWRYAKGIPKVVESAIWLGDSRVLMHRVQSDMTERNSKPFKLLFTSPPYMNVIDYHRDQWLRLWMLGGNPIMARTGEKNKGAFASQRYYQELMRNVFLQCAEVMSPSGYVYVRTDAREDTFEITWNAIRNAFPNWKGKVMCRPYTKPTQTALFGDRAKKPGEKDIILKGPRA